MPSPYTKAAGTFGEAARETATSLSAVPVTMSRTCWNLASLDYIQGRVERMKVESVGLPANGNLLVPFTKFRETAKATSTSTYEQYCTSLEKTGDAFTASVGVLLEYGNSLEALAKTAGYDGSDVSKIVTSVAGIRDAVNGSQDASSKAVGAIAEGLAQLGTVIVQARVESNLKDYVHEAGPSVTALTAALVGYVDAVGTELAVMEARQKTLLDTLETRAGLSAQVIKPPACAKEQPGSNAGADPQLADVCDSLSFLARRSDGMVALSFYTFAVKTVDEIHEAERLREGFKSVLTELTKAHASLVDARQAPGDVKQALAQIAELVSKLSTLKAALQSDEEK